MPPDLRSYLDLVNRLKPDELQIVSRKVDPVHEITALVMRLKRRRGAAPCDAGRTSPPPLREGPGRPRTRPRRSMGG